MFVHTRAHTCLYTNVCLHTCLSTCLYMHDPSICSPACLHARMYTGKRGRNSTRNHIVRELADLPNYMAVSLEASTSPKLHGCVLRGMDLPKTTWLCLVYTEASGTFTRMYRYICTNACTINAYTIIHQHVPCIFEYVCRNIWEHFIQMSSLQTRCMVPHSFNTD